MFRKFVFSAAILAGCATFAQASAQDDIQAALQKLADSPNYSWKSTIEGGNGGGETNGKTQKDGLTMLSVTRQDNTSEAIAQGDKAAVKTADGWKTAAEIIAAAGGGGGGGGGGNPDRFMAMQVQNYKTPVALGLEMVGKLENVKKTDDAYTADLSMDAAKQALSFRRRRANAGGTPPQISNAKGALKIWIKDGMLTKIENHVTGTVNFNGNDNDVDRTTTTEFKDVGSTTLSVPDDAKAMLTAPTTPKP